MRLRAWLACAALAVCASGCIPVPSLHPFFETERCVEAPGVTGVWSDSSTVIELRRMGPNAYSLSYQVSDSTSFDFGVRFAKFGGRLFADVEANLGSSGDCIDEPFALPMHTLFRVDQSGDSLRLAFLDDDWTKGALERRRVKVRHDFVDSGLLLTDRPAQLQAMLGRIASEVAAFDTSGGYLRRR